MHAKSELDKRLQQAKITPLKQLGQNFLLNPKICQAIVDSVASFNPKTVVEIGPGLGALTDDLLGKSWELQVIEFDKGIVEFWRKIKPELKITQGDALKTNWQEFEVASPGVIVSNLPYSIAGSLMVDLSRVPDRFTGLVFMFQKEVAERIESPVHGSEYGMLSVVCQAHWQIKRIIDAGPQDFYPVPHVGSRVLKFSPKKVDFDSQKFLRFVKLGFSQRRKKLSSNLEGGYSRGRIHEVFEKMGLGQNVRAQELSPEQFVHLLMALEHGPEGAAS